MRLASLGAGGGRNFEYLRVHVRGTSRRIWLEVFVGATRRRRTLREKIKLLIFFLIIFNLPEQNPKGPLDLLSPNVVNETHAPGLFSKSEAVPKQRQNIRSLEAPVRETCAEQNETRRFFNKAREQEWFRSGLVVASHSSDTFCHNPPPPAPLAHRFAP